MQRPQSKAAGSDHSVHVVLTSRFANIEIAERAMLDLCTEAGIAGDDCYWMVTALREAVANAILHGNRRDPRRDVRIDLAVRDDIVTITVEDEGAGFSPDGQPDPTDPELLLRPSGRGIFYMRKFMDAVNFRRVPGGGTVVEMTRRVDPETRSRRNEK